MKTQTLQNSTALAIFFMLLGTFITNAQIPIKGLHADHEGVASWNADGSGPEPAATGHQHPFGWPNTFFYTTSVDYDNIDPDPDAALAHVEGNIIGFPLFEQSLADNGFEPSQVKIKIGLMTLGNDLEGEDWFTLNGHHYFNYYDTRYVLELDGESMISGYFNFAFCSYDETVYNQWQVETNYGNPDDVSHNSSPAVRNVAAAFLADLEGEELRLTYDILQSAGIPFTGNGRDGVFFEIVSGSIEKGLPALPFTGLTSDHESLAGWNADGSGPEPAKEGHTVQWGGNTYEYSYYWASRDYDGIDPNPNAALAHFVDDVFGFPNLKIQLDYRKYTLNQLKVKAGLFTLGNDLEGFDWGLDGSIHWWNSYGTTVTIEIAGEPILEYVIDTNFSQQDMANMSEDWVSTTTMAAVSDISLGASDDAQQVAKSFMKDLSGHLLQSQMEGYFANEYFDGNGRYGAFQDISGGKLTAYQPQGTHVWDSEVSGTWTLDNSPYIIMNEINVPDGQQLTIEPGVEIKFSTTERFDIQGCLLAEGTEELPILFTAVDPNVSWGGVVWDQTPETNPTSVLEYCLFEHSYAYGTDPGYNCGGAIRINLAENINVNHCVFRNNRVDKFLATANPAGGAIVLFESSVHISHCIFHDNEGSWGGAIAVCMDSDPVINDCLFYNNESIDYDGGAVLVWTDCNPSFVNCTFADNHALGAGGAVELELGGKTTFTNCIFWGNTADGVPNQINIWQQDPPMLNVYYCAVEDDTLGITPGFQGAYIGNTDQDPEFITVGSNLFVPDTVNSPCVNEGTTNPEYLPENYVFPEYCLCGNERICNGEVDMGCYESPVLFPYIEEEEDMEGRFMNIYPNPINANPTVEFYLEQNTSVTFSVLDIHGKIVFEQNVSESMHGRNSITWIADDLAPGVYFCNLRVGNESYFEKIIKM